VSPARSERKTKGNPVRRQLLKHSIGSPEGPDPPRRPAQVIEALGLLLGAPKAKLPMQPYPQAQQSLEVGPVTRRHVRRKWLAPLSAVLLAGS
jgi:hypothetical protein